MSKNALGGTPGRRRKTNPASTGVLAGVDALVSRRVVGQTINLAYGLGNSLGDVVNIISLALQKEPKATYLPSRTGEVTRYVADIGKARSLLGYNPQVPLSSGLIRAVQWWKSTRKEARTHGD